MKVIVEFDPKVDREQIVQLAVRAEGIYYLIDDLLNQLSIWTDEAPEDQQALAFQRTRRWLWDEIKTRGLLVDESTKGVFCDQAGNRLVHCLSKMRRATEDA